MPEKLKMSAIDLEKTIMSKVKSNEISMKPKWHFVLGSVLMIMGLVASSVGAIFLINLTLFLTRQHGPNGQYRLQQIVGSFPMWIPALAVVGILSGIGILRKYDFSYKKNFWYIVIGFVVCLLLAALVIDQLGLNDAWSRHSPMRRFYQQVEGQNPSFHRGSGQGRGQGNGHKQ